MFPKSSHTPTVASRNSSSTQCAPTSEEILEDQLSQPLLNTTTENPVPNESCDDKDNGSTNKTDYSSTCTVAEVFAPQYKMALFKEFQKSFQAKSL